MPIKRVLQTVLAIAIAVPLICFAQRSYRWEQYIGLSREIKDDFGRLASRPPDGANKNWGELVKCVQNMLDQAIGPAYSSYDELKDFQADFRQMLANGKPATKEELDQLIGRIERVSSFAQKYATRFRPEYERIANETFTSLRIDKS